MQRSRHSKQQSPKRFGLQGALAIAAFIALLGSLPFTSTDSFFSLNAWAKPMTHSQRHSPASGQEAKGSASLESLPEKMEAYLSLNPEQRARISRLSAEGRRKSRPYSQKLITARQQFWTYLKSPDATEAGAKKKANELRALRHQLGEIRLHTWFAIRGVLTETQLEKLQHSPL